MSQDSWKHIKSGGIYTLIDSEVELKTDPAYEGEKMILYEKNGKRYIRRYNDFHTKFTPHNE